MVRILLASFLQELLRFYILPKIVSVRFSHASIPFISIGILSLQKISSTLPLFQSGQSSQRLNKMS